MPDRDTQLISILQIARDTSPRGAGISIRAALKRVGYASLRTTFKANDLLPLIAANPTLIEDWLAYSEDKRTRGGWYILRNGEIGQVSKPASRTTYSSIEQALAEYVVRELEYWTHPDEFPHGWTKTVSDVFAESKDSRRPVGPPETDWALAYERSVLRPWARFPMDGEVYEALEDTPIPFLTHWRAPFTGGGEGTLPKGTQVRVTVSDSISEPIRVYAHAIDAPAIERLLVSEGDRTSAKYNGFSLSISTADLNKKFRLIKGEASAALGGRPASSLFGSHRRRVEYLALPCIAGFGALLFAAPISTRVGLPTWAVQLAGLIVGSCAVYFMSRPFRCPGCRTNLMWHMMSKEPIGNWLLHVLALESCPKCGHPDRGHENDTRPS